ncbi:MAG: YmdB family metallophosphoesterase, partial [Oscillospiraceae bacterium]|nr:YmdB family metallophosphoesterase [Oscillospiraceae bacterium]
MKVNILAVGDVVGNTGLDVLAKKLRGLQRLYNISFTVVNGE